MMRRFRQFPTIGGRRGGIPADCVEVQYLESPMVSNQSLGAYIDTGIIPQYGDAVTLDVDIPNLENYWLTALAIYNPTFRVTARLTSSAKYWFTEGFTRPTEPTGRNEWHGTYTYSASYSPLSISLNAQHESGRFVNRGVGIKYYSFSVTRNGSLLLDLVPVRRVENGVSVGYMCDRLTGQLYGNQGTGAFVVGPDKGAWTNPYVTDGLVAMWDGEWNAGGGVHDAAATVIKDLIGDNDAILQGGAWTVNDKSIAFASNTFAWFDDVNSVSFELVYKQTSTMLEVVTLSNVRRFFCLNNSRGISLQPGVAYSFAPSNMVGKTNSYYAELESRLLQNGVEIANAGSAFSNYYTHAGLNASQSVRGDFEIYSLRVYNRALTADEIAANYAVDRERFGIN